VQRSSVVLAAALTVSSLVGEAKPSPMPMRPDPLEPCRIGKTWPAIQACLNTHGSGTTLAELDDARIVAFFTRTGQPDARHFEGTYLFAKRGDHWALVSTVGMDDHTSIERFEHVTVAGHDAYHARERLERTLPASTPDGVPLIGQLVMRSELYCAAAASYCARVTSACDYIVDGNARWSYRGEVAIAGNALTISGDRSHTNPLCNTATVDRVELGW